MNAPVELDPLTSSRVRAGVLAFLQDSGAADFVELAKVLEVANNTLSSHLQRLEAAAYIELRRGFLGRKPRTRVVMTATGRQAWWAHLERLEAAGRTRARSMTGDSSKA